MKWVFLIPVLFILGDSPSDTTKIDSCKEKVLTQQALVQSDIDTIKTDISNLLRKLDSINGKEKKLPGH